MILGIDASNLRGGGGITHLVELLRAARPQEHGFSHVFVWGGAATLKRLQERSWLHKVHEPLLDRSLAMRLYWQRSVLTRRVRSAGCDILFVPGGSLAGFIRPFVTMSRNMLPFEWLEARRYGVSWTTLRLLLLRWSQSRTFRAADGMIFLTQYAQDGVLKTLGHLPGKTATIPHGVDAEFLCPPRTQKDMQSYSLQEPFRILYVSIVLPYKHHWNVVEAVADLRKKGYPVELDLLGPAYPKALARLQKAIDEHDPMGSFVRYHGAVPHSELPHRYHHADAFVFASSCENLPNILLEAMAAGLPITCSRRGPMPEVAADAALYFDPDEPEEIASALEQLIVAPALRAAKAKAAFERAGQYSWDRCAWQTFQFLRSIIDAV